MAEADTWESIKKYGLLSTSALLDKFEITGAERFKIESQHRPECVQINHPKYGLAVIRDQKPMSNETIQKCLTDMTPQQWYECLNRKVFFWLTRERLMTMLNARAYRDRVHCVIIIKTLGFLKAHLECISLSPMNTGCTRPRPWPRGSETFQRFSKYPFAERMGRHLQLVVEMAVDYEVQNIEKYVVRVEQIRGDKVLNTEYGCG